MTALGTTSRPVRIAGAGLAGLTCALTLAKAGRIVEVYEQRAVVAGRFHGSWQILENYSTRHAVLDELAAMGCPDNYFRCAGHQVDFYDCRLSNRRLQSQQPFGYYVMRGPGDRTIDRAFQQAAENAGVRIHWNSRLPVEESDIQAGGAKKASGIAQEMVFRTNLPDTFITLLDHRYTPGGFAYLFVIDGYATLGAAILRNFRRMKDCFTRVTGRFQEIIPFDIVSPRTSGSFVQFYLPSTACVENRLLVGENAGFQDYLFGLGIRRSITSGYLAARSILDHTNYDELWKLQFGHRMKAGIVHRFLFETAGNTGMRLLLRAGGWMDFRSLGYRLNNPGYMTSALWPVVRAIWKHEPHCANGPQCAWCRTVR